MTYKFQVGEKVELSGGYASGAGGTYEVVRQLPPINGDNQYQIKSEHESHQRVAGEHTLKPGREQSRLDTLFRPRH
ncbi:MAG TPA: hypothetical protein VNR11_19970 [Xanthobacteraceae bacterium]|nr:hypothetical protein [Xanthobacteraceae bacterium]